MKSIYFQHKSFLILFIFSRIRFVADLLDLSQDGLPIRQDLSPVLRKKTLEPPIFRTISATQCILFIVDVVAAEIKLCSGFFLFLVRCFYC